MALHISFAIDASNPLAGLEYVRDSATASYSELTWNYFIGDVSIATDRHRFATKFGWVAVLDFATNVAAIGSRIGPGNEKTYWFKESNDWFSFLRTDCDQVVIASSFIPGIGICAYADFFAETAAFLDRTVERLVSEFPRLGLNPVLNEIRRRD